MKAVDMARNNIRVVGLVAILCIGGLFMLINPLRVGIYSTGHGHASSRTGVTHMVMFQFKDNAGADAIAEINRRMLALKDGCLHPLTHKPYIRSLTGGKDNSIEGLQNGVTHAFVVEFGSPADRDFYVKADPTHQAFIKAAGAVVEKATVVDFSDGVF